jgi:UDP-glucose 4-epimerase
MKKILITGAAGFIGNHLINHMVDMKYQFILLDNFSRGKKDKAFKEIIKRKNVKLINVDLVKPYKLKFKNIKYVFHLAAKVGVKNVVKKPSETINDNLLMLINTIKALKNQNKNAKFIFFSTSEVYSPLIDTNVAKFPLNEDVNLIIKKKTKARDSYYISKLVGEKIVELSGLKYLNLRPHNIYGTRMGFSHVIPELIRKFMTRSKNIKIYSPAHTRAFCYVDDAINQMVNLALNKNAKNKAFNIGNNTEEIKIIELANKIKKLLPSNKKIIRGSVTPGSPKRRVPDLKLTKKFSKNSKFTNLNVGLKNYISWFLNS